MKRWEIPLAAIGAILLAGSAWVIRRTELPHSDFVLTESGCHIPVTVIEPFSGKAQNSAVVFHGLTANRRIMQTLASYLATHAGLRAYLIDFPGHGDNTDSFSFPRVEQCAAAAVESLTRTGKIDPSRTVFVGHSMGGAVALRLADREPVAATIAISPAPTELPRRMPSNLLVFSAQFDVGILRRGAAALSQAASGERNAPDDFIQQRAFHVEHMPLSAHTTLIFDPRVLKQSSQWIRSAIRESPAPQGGSNVLGRLAAADAGLAGLLLLMPMATSTAARIAGPDDSESAGAKPTTVLALAEGAACAVVTALILKLGVPLKLLHLYAGDYLSSLLLIVGVFLLALNWKAAKEACSLRARTVFAAALLGFATMLAFGGWLNWQLTDMWLNAPRWLRFFGVLPIAAIYCFAEEVVLAPVGRGRERALRFAAFIGLRMELWLACLLAYYTLASGQVLILILVAFFAAFSILQRLATDALRLRTGSATAAALFGAILAAWFIAGIFPLT